MQDRSDFLQKSILETEEDVDKYSNDFKEALKNEIRLGKKFQLNGYQCFKKICSRCKTNFKKLLRPNSSLFCPTKVLQEENQKAITELENRIRRYSEEQVIEEVAYTWFNRLCALQYMDVNGYNSIRVISPPDNQTRPEILSDANAGVFDNKII